MQSELDRIKRIDGISYRLYNKIYKKIYNYLWTKFNKEYIVIYKKRRRELNLEKTKIFDKRTYRKRKEYFNRYYIKNKIKLLKSNKEYYNKNKFIVSLRNSEWKKRNRKRVVSYTINRRKKVGRNIDINLIQLVYEDNIKKYGKLTCYLCQNPIIFGKDTIEHKIPIARGGKNSYENLEISCLSCNSKKHTKTYKEYKKETDNVIK